MKVNSDIGLPPPPPIQRPYSCLPHLSIKTIINIILGSIQKNGLSLSTT